MKCQTFKKRWFERDGLGAVEDADLMRHRADCAVCREMSARLDALRQEARSLHAGVQPDAGFSAGVLQRIEATPDSVEILGWAAWRMLPAAMVLLVTLLAWGSSVGWTPERVEILLLQESPSHIAVELLLSAEEER